MTASGGAQVLSYNRGGPAVTATIFKLGPLGEPLGTVDATGHPSAIGLDPATGNLFVSDQVEPGCGCRGPAALLEYAPSGTQIERFGTGQVIGGPQGNALAFGEAANAVYVVSDEERLLSAAQMIAAAPAGPLVSEGSLIAKPIRTTAATLNGTLDSEGAETKYAFRYITEAAYMENVKNGHPGFTGATAAGEGTLPAAFTEPQVSVAISGLRGETAYRFCLLASNVNRAGNTTCASADDEGSFTTLPTVVIEEEFVSAVTASSATLAARVNPLGNESEYHLEYLTEAQFKADGESFSGPYAPLVAPQPDAVLAGVEEPVSVSVHLQGLAPGTVYRYRLVAHNAGGLAAGVVRAFTTQTTGAFALSDGREWELVSPAHKEGVPLTPPGEKTDQAAVSGDAVTYKAWWGTEPVPEGNAGFVTVLSARGRDGWVSRDLVPAKVGPAGKTAGHADGPSEYKLFSEDLSIGVVQPYGAFNPALSPDASEQTAFLHTDFPAGEPGALCTSSCYRPLVTGCPPAGQPCPPGIQEHADVAPGTEFGLSPDNGLPCLPQVGCGPEFEGASPDFSHVVLKHDEAVLVEGERKGSLYEWSADRPASEQLQLVSVLPPNGKNEELPDAGSAELTLGSDHVNSIEVRNAISADGSRVVWSDGKGSGQHLYLRDMTRGKTVQLDAVQGGSGNGLVEPLFQTASRDGSRVFFTDSQLLTAGSTKNDLYVCEISEVEGRPTCKLSDLGPAEGVIGASQDGSYAYIQGAAGLEVLRYDSEPGHEGWQAPQLIAASGADGIAFNDIEDTIARVSPNGRWLAFMSNRSLTGYDNRDAVSGELDEEVFLYSAAGAGGAGKLVCASCNPTGARPHGIEAALIGQGNGGLAGGWVWGGSPQGLAANIPGWVPLERRGTTAASVYQPRYLSNNGRLFFNSSDALVPQDTNGTEDVYEFEPVGEGSCTEGTSSGSSVYVQASGGCVGLISSGTSPLESAFLDASESGDDVFFETSAKLVPQDTDDALDVYDAHVCGVGWQCPPPPPPPLPACEGDACQSPASAPEDPTPGSFTYRGPGNLVAALTPPSPAKKKTAKAVGCRKPRRLAHGICVRVKAKRHGAKKSAKGRK